MTPLQKVMEYATYIGIIRKTPPEVLPGEKREFPRFEVRVTVPHPQTGAGKMVRIDCDDPEDGLLEAWVQAMREHERSDQVLAHEQEHAACDSDD